MQQQDIKDFRKEVVSVLKPKSRYVNEEYKKKQEYDQLVRHASIRSAFNTQQQLQASAEQDPDERTGILNNAKDQIASPLTDFQMPVPHMQRPQFNDELANDIYKNKANFQQFGTVPTQKLGPDGKTMMDYETTKSGIPNSAILKPIQDITRDGQRNAKTAMQNWLKLPESHDPAAINYMNQVISERAAQRGIPPVFAATVGPDGQIHYNPNAGQALAAHYLYSHGALYSEDKPSKDREEAAAAASKLLSDKAERAAKWAGVAKTMADIDKVKSETGSDDEEVKGALSSVYNVISKAKEATFTGVNDAFGGLPEPQKVQAVGALTNSGLDLSKVKVTPLNPNDEDVMHMGGEQKSIGGNLVLAGKKPTEAYLVDGGTGNPKDDKYLASFIKETPQMKDGKPTGVMEKEPYWKVVSLPEAARNYVFSNRNYSEGDKDKDNRLNEVAAKAKNRMAEMLGETNTQQQAAPKFKPFPDYQKQYPDLKLTPQYNKKTGDYRYIDKSGGIWVYDNNKLVKAN